MPGPKPWCRHAPDYQARRMTPKPSACTLHKHGRCCLKVGRANVRRMSGQAPAVTNCCVWARAFLRAKTSPASAVDVLLVEACWQPPSSQSAWTLPPLASPSRRSGTRNWHNTQLQVWLVGLHLTGTRARNATGPWAGLLVQDRPRGAHVAPPVPPCMTLACGPVSRAPSVRPLP